MRWRTILKGLGIAFAVLLLALGVVVWYIGFHDRGLNLDFDPVLMARAETRMWQAYYAGKGEDMALEMVGLMREQMGISLKTAMEVVEPMARGAMAFSRSRGNFEQQVLPKMEKAYARLAEACGKDWDAHELAVAELDWWVARRTPGEDSPEQVGARIAHLYALLYGKTNADIEEAGLLRAEAAALRDAGGVDADWPAVEELLVKSYTALKRGINAG